MAASLRQWCHHGCLAATMLAAGCASHSARHVARSQKTSITRPPTTDASAIVARRVDRITEEGSVHGIERAAYQEPEVAVEAAPVAPADVNADQLPVLVSTALASNPRLHQMQQEAAAAWAKVRYVDKLPDPEIGAMAVVPPMHYADGRQVAVVSFNQRIPWLKRLSAKEQQACLEAWAQESSWQAERLRVVSEVKIAYYRLYVVQQQRRVNRENAQLIELLINVATQRVVAQASTEGDVLLGTLELTRLEEERFGLEERQASLQAGLNRLLNRPAETPVLASTELQLTPPQWSLDTLRQTAWTNQPDIAAAQLRTQAAAWGIRVAELERRPEITLNMDWMVMTPQQEPGMPAFGGDDSVQIGAMVSVPLWHGKYSAMRDEAIRDDMARRFSLYDVQREYEANLAELLEQARAAFRTTELYNSTMLPQARRTFSADQQAYVGPGTIEFDRVVEDFRTVLALEEGYHRAMGDWAIALARIEQATASNIASLPTVPEPAPPAEIEFDDRQEEVDANDDEIQLMAAELVRSPAQSRRPEDGRQLQTFHARSDTPISGSFASGCGAAAAGGAAQRADR